MKGILNFIYKIRILLTALGIWFLIDLVSWVSSKINLLDTLEYSIEDFDFTDMHYSGFEKRKTPIDSNIVLVNIGDLSRDEIAKQIEIINQYQPKVIGLDVTFPSLSQPEIDSVLHNALNQVNNLVMGMRMSYDSDTENFNIMTSHPYFGAQGKQAFIGLIGDGVGARIGTVREIFTNSIFQNKYYYPFATELVRVYKPEVFFRFVSRNNFTEWINYKRRINRYQVLDIDQVLMDQGVEIVKDKIVIFGFMGNFIGDTLTIADKYYSPLNTKFVGRSHPDMYGVVMHANVASMLLDEDFVEIWSGVSYYITMILCFLSVVFFNLIYNTYQKNYQLFSKISAFIMINIFLLSTLWIFSNFQIKIDLRFFIIYLIFAPDGFEIIEVNVFDRLRRKLNSK